ncbi:MAG: CynX/NimT family MFS transporter [Fusobacteriaceae bacterium]
MNQVKIKHKEDIFTPTSLMLIIGISFLATNLRAPLTSVGPLVSLIRDNLDISNTLAGMITTLPLFAFALFSPLVPGIARKYGAEVVLFWSVIPLTIGILLRSWSGSFNLFLGTAILGLSISVGNVLIPSLIKKYFPSRVGVMTGVYSVSMNVFAALASGVSIPLAINLGLGWSGALKIWAIPSFISLLLWIPQLRRKNEKTSAAEKINITLESNIEKVNMWKSPLAWQVTIYMGLQSMVFYCMVAWLPNILTQYGMASGKAGWMLSLLQLALIPMTFVGAILAGRKSNQHSLVTIGSTCIIIGLLGLLFFGNSEFIFLFIIILGIGGGFAFSLSMMFFSLRTKNADDAARLSGMAQSIGYLLAAFGPMFFGFLHDATNSWGFPIIILIIISVICLISGLGASRNLHVSKE